MNLLESELINLENDGFLIKSNILKNQEIDQYSKPSCSLQQK